MHDIDWKGVFPAATTQLNTDGSVDLAETVRGVDRLVAAGVKGVVMLGMVGENSVLNAHEKTAVIKSALDACRGKVSVLGGVAELSTPAACGSAREYARLGVDGLMVFPAIGYKSDAKETAAYYRAVGQATRLPILVYNNPSAYGVDATPDVLADLADEETIVAVKEESYDVRRVTDICSRFGDRFTVICGADDLLLESVMLGAVGWVSGMANVYPRESVDLLNLALAGRWDEARELYRVLTPIYHLDTKTKLVQYIKFAAQLRGAGTETVRPPRLPLGTEERELTRRIVEQTDRELAALRKAHPAVR